jgi:hypothetical protein
MLPTKRDNLRLVVDTETGQRMLKAEDAMNFVRDRIYLWDIKALASECGVTTSCLYSIRAGRTEWPRGKTLFRLLEALDLELWLKVKSPH